MVRPNRDRNDDFRPLSAYDHAPTIGPADVDKCRECGRYAPHAFDHAPRCSRFAPIEDEPDVDPARANPRMAVPATDGGSIFEPRDQSPESIASCIVAASKGDRVTVHVDVGDDKTVSIYEGEVGSTGYKEHDSKGGTHVVAIDLPDRRVAVRFDRRIDFDLPTNLTEPEPVLFDPREGERYKVTGFDTIA